MGTETEEVAAAEVITGHELNAFSALGGLFQGEEIFIVLEKMPGNSKIREWSGLLARDYTRQDLIEMWATYYKISGAQRYDTDEWLAAEVLHNVVSRRKLPGFIEKLELSRTLFA